MLTLCLSPPPLLLPLIERIHILSPTDAESLCIMYMSTYMSPEMKTCAVYTLYILNISRQASTDMYCTKSTHTSSHPLLLVRSDWQYSSPNPCRYHLQVHAPTLSSSSVCLKQEMRWESTVKKTTTHQQLCILRAALYLPAQALATHLCSKMAALTPQCSGAPGVKADQTVSPCCVVWQDTHHFAVWPVFPLLDQESNGERGGRGKCLLFDEYSDKSKSIINYFKRQPEQSQNPVSPNSEDMCALKQKQFLSHCSIWVYSWGSQTFSYQGPPHIRYTLDPRPPIWKDFVLRNPIWVICFSVRR